MANPKTTFVIDAENRASKVLRQVETDVKGLGSAAASFKSMLSGFGGGLLGGIVGGLSLGALAGGVKDLARLGEEVTRLAKLSGSTTQEFQRLAAGAELVGIHNDKLADIFKDVQNKVGDFLQNGGGPLKDFFENIASRVGVTAEQFRNLSGPQALGLYVRSLEQAGLSQSEMTFYMEAIANDATLLLPLLVDNARGFREAGDQAERMGAILSEKTIREAEGFRRQMVHLGQQGDALKISFFGPIIEALNELSTSFRNARAEGLGFFNSLGTDSTNIDGQIEFTQRKLAGLRKQLDAGGRDFYGRPVDTTLLETQIREAELLLTRLVRVRHRLMGRDPDTGSYGPLVSEPPIGTSGGSGGGGGKSKAKGSKTLDIFDARDKRIASLVDRAINENDLERAEDYATALQRIDVLFEAGLLNVEEYDAAIAALSESTTTSGAEGEKALEGLAEKWKDLIDPTREYQRHLEEIRRLVASGKLTRDQGIAAEFEIENRRQDSIFGDSDFAKEAEANAKAAHELGLTFDSMFEEAIIEGKKFSEVLSGIGQDLLRLTIRKSITEPAADWLTTTLNLGSLFGGKSHADGLDYVPYDNYPALLHKGERVQTAAEARKGGSKPVTINQTLHVGAGASRSELVAAMVIAKEEAKREIYESMRNGGVFS